METAQEQRLRLRFELWDTDGDGSISLDDFVSEAHAIVDALGVSKDSQKGKAVIGAYTQMFPDPAKLSGVLDSVGGLTGGPLGGATDAAAITADQFVTLADTLLVSAGDAGYDALLAPTIRAIARACDTDDDGQVEAEDFKSWLGVIGVDASTADEAFAGLDSDGDGKVAVDDIVTAVRDYHMGRLDVPLLGS